MQALKNPLQILKSFSEVIKNYPSARLFMIGAKPAELLNFVNEQGLENSVSFYEEMSQETLVKFLQPATALILVSSYETFGCVIIEANACGVPVIVSDIPVFHETVKQDVNGVFTKLNDSNHLANAMMQCFQNRNNFNRAGIAALAASRYSYTVVGKMFENWYDAIIGENKD
jgi:glycosyltransferase involved in cell wall biosynthesis